MNKLKYIFFSIFWLINITYANSLKDKMLNIPWEKLWLEVKEEAPLLVQIVKSFEALFYTIIGIVGVAVFAYFWIKLITSRWDEKAFTNAKNWIIYAVIWLAIIPLSMTIIKLIKSLNF